ncbi:RNA polymerase sigma factor [Bacteroides sp. 224]|uniref:RNA polymerase sigma factor n=1 Tax=Bacteroides sp. 224 TaxID=2302936 RepID=UPI0013CFE4A0|nr:RNA polymerase sigma-70 factor [Bacteroides sp. 224]NDV65407.1 RNA polymerase sigma-70 factor [Bacteroides sp. 224]
MDIVDKIRTGDEKAFKQLFLKFYPLLCGIADNYLKDENLSKDMAQEAFIRLWNKKEGFEHLLAIKSFLFITVKNLCLNHIRDHRTESLPITEISDNPEADFEAILLEEEAINLLYTAINQLPSQSSKIIKMSIKGLKNQEIAEKLGISVNTVKTLKYNAIKKLKDILKENIVILLFFMKLMG